MKKNRGLWIAVGMVAGLGGFLAWDLQSEKKETEQKKQSALLFDLKPDQVNEFTITKGADRLRLSRGVDGWKIEEPVKDSADDSYTDDFVDRAVKDSYVEVAKEGADIDWKVYGLEPPQGEITFKTQAGAEKTLQISAKQNFEQNSIARIKGENRVLIIPSAWSAHLARLALDFRDKRFYRFKIASIDHLELYNAKGTLKIDRKEGGWESDLNKEWLLDQNRIRELLTMLSETHVRDFISTEAPTPAQKKEFGLLKPAVVLRLRAKDKDWTGAMGRDTQKGEYAHISDPLFTVKLENGSIAKFDGVSLESLRDRRQPFLFDKALAKNAEFKSPIKTTPLDKPEDVARTLRDWNALTFADAASVARWSDKHKIVLTGDDKKTVFELIYGDPFSYEFEGRKTTVVAAKSNLNADVFLLEEAQIEKLQPKAEAKPIEAKPKPSQTQPAAAKPAAPPAAGAPNEAH